MEGPVHVPEWSPEELARRIEAGDDVHVLDVRAPFRLESGRIDIVSPDRFHNVPGSQLLARDDPTADLPRTSPIAVVCGHGNDSRVIAGHLNARGRQSISLSGGMSAWMALSLPRELRAPAGCDRFLQFDRIGKGALAYAVVSDGQALIIDPPRHTRVLLEAIDHGRTRVIGVADTHAHADYISGGPALARELGVPYYLHPADGLYPYDGTPGTIEFDAAEEGTEIRVGRVRVRVVHTPGHTEGSVSYLLGDEVALTGDFLFVESVGRPDLGGKTEAWARVLWKSVERARADWPPSLRICPAHYASAAERNSDHSVGRSFGELPRSNAPLGLGSEKDFLEWILSKAGSFPESYRRIKAINIGLDHPSEADMEELEAGRNQCALG